MSSLHPIAPQSRLRRLGWPALLLALTLAALLASYLTPAALRVDVGDQDDWPFVAGFHEGEIRTGERGQPIPWPAGSDTIRVPGGSLGDQLVLVETAEEFRGALPLSLATYADGQRIGADRATDGMRGIRIIVPEAIASKPSYDLQITYSLAHTTIIAPVTPLTATPALLRSYRWTTDAATLRLPGSGTGAWLAQLTTIATHPDGSPVEARVQVGDVQLAIPEHQQARRISLLIPPAAAASGDVELRLYANTFEDPRQVGMLVEDFQLRKLASDLALPPLWLTALALLLVAAAERALAVAGLGRGLRLALLAALLALGSWALIAHRPQMAVYLPRLTLAVILSLGLLLGLRALLGRIRRADGQPLALGVRHALLLIVLLSFWAKVGGVVWPYMVAIDMRWHMDKTEKILDGKLPELYQPGAFSESVMPVGEWGEERPIIPYSPFYHIFATIFALFPWQIDLTAKVFSTILDASNSLLIFLIAVRSGLRERVGLLAAGLYAVLPVTFLLQSWGNGPTALGMWWALLTMTLIIGLWGRLRERRWLIVLTAIITCAMLFYTVMAVFLTLTLLIWMGFVRLIARAERGERQIGAVLLALLGGIALSLLIYYGQYLEGIITVTIPYFFQGGRESAGIGVSPLGEYLALHIQRLWDYGLLIPLLVGPLGLFLSRRHRLLMAWSGAVFVVSIIFLFVGRQISMVDKHVFYAIPPLMIGTAAVLDRLPDLARLRLRAAQRLAWLPAALLYSSLLVAALLLWVERIAQVRQ